MNISVNGIDAWIGAGVDFLERQFGLSVNPIIAERIIVLGLAISLVVTLLNFHSEARYWMKVFFRTFRSLRLWSGLTIRQKLLVFLNTSESIVTIGLIFYIIKYKIDYDRYFNNIDSTLSSSTWKTVFTEKWTVIIFGCSVLWLLYASRKDAKNNLKIANSLFSAENKPVRLKKSEDIYNIISLFVVFQITFLLLAWSIDRFLAFCLAMLIFYITSYLNHRFTIPSILSEIDDPNLKPLEDDPRKVLINYRRIIIKDFISKNPLIEKEAVVAITIFIVLVLTTARLLGWLNIPDVFLYCTMFLIIISNEVTIYVWRHRRNKKLFALTLSRENRCMSETQEANSKVSGVSGIYRLLALMPIWAIAFVLFIITDGVVYLSRDWLEGLSYQVAYSAHFGDAALLIAVLIVAAIIQRGPIIIPKTLRNSNTHWRVFIASVFAGAALCWVTWGFRSTQFADMYHDILIGPLILFFAITLLPVIYFNGSRFEKIATLFFISLWAVLIVYDVQSDRMDQRSWLQNHGFRLHN